MAGLLDQLEIEIANRIMAFPFFANFTVHADPQKNPVEQIDHLVGKVRTLVAPFVNAATDGNPNIPSPYFNEIQIDVGVFQNPLVAAAASHPMPREICEQLHAVLKGWKPDSLSNVITARRPGISYNAQFGNLNIWNASFSTMGGFITTLNKVATPAAVVDTHVTLSCATAGAAIFYTADGSQPAPLNGTLYLAPFATPVAGTKIRARAFLAGYLDSAPLAITT